MAVRETGLEVLSETAGARVLPGLIPCIDGSTLLRPSGLTCLRPDRTSEHPGRLGRLRGQDQSVVLPGIVADIRRDGRSQPEVLANADRQTGKSLQWTERLRKSSSPRLTVSSRTPMSWLWLTIRASPSPRCRTCASR